MNVSIKWRGIKRIRWEWQWWVTVVWWGVGRPVAILHFVLRRCFVPCRPARHRRRYSCGWKDGDRRDSTVLEQRRSCHRPTANPDLICLHYAQLISFISVIAYSHFIAVSILNFTQCFLFQKMFTDENLAWKSGMSPKNSLFRVHIAVSHTWWSPIKYSLYNTA